MMEENKGFTITCNECGSTDCGVDAEDSVGEYLVITIRCGNPDCLQNNE